jgi:hypothetical protein
MTERLFAPSLSDAVKGAHRIARQAQALHQPVKSYALFSGGDDSTLTLRLMAGLIDAAVFVDTGTGLECARRHVEDTAAKWGVELIILRTPWSVYESELLRFGFPNSAQHPTYYQKLKDDRLREFLRLIRAKHYRSRHDRVMFFTGIRRHESRKRAVAPEQRKEGSLIWVNPIVDFDSELMMAARMEFDLPRSEASIHAHRSGECLCLANMSRGEWETIRLFFPDDPAVRRHAILEARVVNEGTVEPKRCHPFWAADSPNPRSVGPLCDECSLFAASPSTGEGTPK